MKHAYKSAHKKGLAPYDMMLFTNLFMCIIAFGVAMATDQLFGGITFLTENPECFMMVSSLLLHQESMITCCCSQLLKFSACSAIGQYFIFFTIANLGPLTCSTVTTTRKIFSVLLSIFVHGHSVFSIE